MVLLPAPAGPSMAMMSLRAENSVIGKGNDCTRGKEGDSDVLVFLRLLAVAGEQLTALRAGRGSGGRFGRGDLNQRAISYSNKVQLARGQQRIDCFLHSRAGNEVTKESLDL